MSRILAKIDLDAPVMMSYYSKFPKFSFFMKAFKIGIFRRFLAEQKMHYLAIFLPNSTLTGMSYLYRFWTGDYMVWGSISFVAGFPKKENSLETLIVIFQNFTKGFL